MEIDKASCEWGVGSRTAVAKEAGLYQDCVCPSEDRALLLCNRRNVT